ncbi:UDP-N-acetylglucosamine 2-epimerase (non-hydrolyzing) [Lactococcus lactis]|uniref:UDP-N-acetylglucosamine 2-epimerase (non-hydrolyzing) n=1 Tax=Lactococcus lactis TaxID=1358 RepID=A0A9X4NJS0_9LACT|nr:UDP-N-acetylglucosamine 2-epimerase (non-hydrolyzing) [Lactococcus lactis]MDG4984974.1 UDP-N-acetylglucosamine 2-epimerase (non-hydrolyzing) [Lactococcus lactis]
MKLKIVVTFGTRPEAIKMMPVYTELKKYPEYFDVSLIVTGQHREMLDQILEIYGVVPDVDFNIMKSEQTLTEITNALEIKYGEYFEKEKPDLVLVHGDTTTALVAAFEAFYNKIKIGHVEAGLRTHNRLNPFPEEINRQLIARFASFHFAPTTQAAENLKKENVQGRIFVTGNTAIDALFINLEQQYDDELLQKVEDDKMIVLTTHRRENLGEAMRNIFLAMKEISKTWPEYSVVYPVHMNPQIRKLATEMLSKEKNIFLIPPVGVVGFHHYLNKAKIILTDSGGIQEEAPSLGKPVLVLRETTERPEGVENGNLRIVGTDKDRIINEVQKLLNDSSYYKSFTDIANPYGDGTAAKRIVDVIKKNLNYFTIHN